LTEPLISPFAAVKDQVPSISEDQLKTKTQKLSIYEGLFGVSSSIIGDNYITPFALAIGSSTTQVGILGSFYGFIGTVGQLLGSKRMEKAGRKKSIFTSLYGQLVMWWVFIGIGILFLNDIVTDLLPWIFLGTVIIYMLYVGQITPAWFSLMGDVVPESHRGRYFAKRNLFCTAVSITAVFIFSLILDGYKANSKTIIGFLFIFLLGFLTRVASVGFFTKHYFPAFEFQQSDHVKFREFVKELPKTNFGKFTLYIMGLYIGVNIAGPFFSVYMLNELGFSYTVFVFINISTSIFAVFAFPLIGKLADRFGNVAMIRFGAIFIPILPLMWIFIKHPIALIFGPQLVGGFAWTAFNLASSNFIYDNIPKAKRGEYVAFYNFMMGIGIVIGGLIGSVLVAFVPPTWINPFMGVFFISGIVRAIFTIIYLPKFKEIRTLPVKPIFNVKYGESYKWLFDIVVRNHRTKKSSSKKPNKKSN
jgi:MFS family permease